ncbi:MAG: hypothetical protein OXQ89_09620 [Rhodospirillaceae bacterium]|nr:hypothetical protein [Rhodospirillaceae bacterium]MDE0361974.1 hypothetical protein [Rhodospirillaceae bacterium]
MRAARLERMLGVLLPLACIIVTLGWMIGALIYFRERAEYTGTPERRGRGAP